MKREIGFFLFLAVLVSPCLAGVYEDMTLAKGGQVIIDGDAYEDYELAQVNPRLASFLSIGQFAHATLKKGGYALGNLVRISTSPLDKELDAQRQPQAWFPMILSLSVVPPGEGEEDGDDVVDDGSKSASAPLMFETRIEYDRKRFVRPGLAITAAHLVGVKAEPASDVTNETTGDAGSSSIHYSGIEVPLPEAPPFMEKYYEQLTGLFGIIIAASLIRIVRVQVLERWWYGGKKPPTEDEGGSQAAEGSDGAATVAATVPAAAAAAAAAATNNGAKESKKESKKKK